MHHCGDESELPGVPGECGKQAVFELDSYQHPSTSFLCAGCVRDDWPYIDPTMITPIDPTAEVEGISARDWLKKL